MSSQLPQSLRWLGMVPRLGPLKWDGIAPPAKEHLLT